MRKENTVISVVFVSLMICVLIGFVSALSATTVEFSGDMQNLGVGEQLKLELKLYSDEKITGSLDIIILMKKCRLKRCLITPDQAVAAEQIPVLRVV